MEDGMRARPKAGQSTRRRVSAAAAGAVLLALLGGALTASPASADAPGTSTTAAPDAGASRILSTSRSGSSLATVTVLRSSQTVYPVADGFQDTVRFAIRATDAIGMFTPVIGTAALTGGGRTVRTWFLDGTSSRISWNGRVGRAIRTGLYTLTVTEYSPDGITRTGRTTVRVHRERRVREVLAMHLDPDRRSIVSRIPAHLLDAYHRGDLELRVRTVAVVNRPAKLRFSNGSITLSTPLRSGTRTTQPFPVRQGFARTTITHGWSKGAARLTSLTLLWVHWDLR
jgi:hypothetical protein